MSWQCNYCGNKTQPIKEVEPNGIDYPAGRACYECGKGEMVYKIERFPQHNNIVKDLMFDFKCSPWGTILNMWTFCSCMIGTYMIFYWISSCVNVIIRSFLYEI